VSRVDQLPEIASLIIADPPGLWNELGFRTDDGACWISDIRHELGATGEGVVAWSLRGIDDISDLPSVDRDKFAASPTPVHPNGVIALDHVVVLTPDLGRTIGAFESAGLELRRMREAGTSDRPTTQAFFKMAQTIVEVVGSPTGSGSGKARFFGLAFTVSDLDATAAFMGERLRPARNAVQTGRRIATLDRSVGSTVPLAFMSLEE